MSQAVDKLPKKIKVGAWEYDILLVDEVEKGDAEIIPKQKEIRLQKDCGKMMPENLMHEVMHSIDIIYNADALTNPEVERISQGVCQVLLDNPEFTKMWLREKK